MPTSPITDWSAVNWHRDNRAIAAEVGAAVDTVAHYRRKYAPETVGKYRAAYVYSPAGKARQRAAPAGHAHLSQPLATEAAKKSPLAGRGEGNVHAKRWVLVDPDGSIHEVVNLHHFVRTHSDLFAPEDVRWKRAGGKRGARRRVV